MRQDEALFALTHNYSGYPMVRQAREMVAAGELGEIRVVQAEYPQDWLSTDLEATGQKQAAWRVDPAQAGAGGSLGDIGTPCRASGALHHRPRARRGERRPDDLRRRAGASTTTRTCCCATRTARAACCGRARSRRATRTRCACASTAARPGSRSRRSNPNQLWFTPLGQAPRLITRGGAGAGAAAGRATRIPAGHPEGYLEGFAQLYRDVAEQLHARREQRAPDPLACLVPTVEDGARGMKFIEAVVESSRADGRWTDARLAL